MPLQDARTSVGLAGAPEGAIYHHHRKYSRHTRFSNDVNAPARGLAHARGYVLAAPATRPGRVHAALLAHAGPTQAHPPAPEHQHRRRVVRYTVQHAAAAVKDFPSKH
jgi:hypothetical protein